MQWKKAHDGVLLSIAKDYRGWETAVRQVANVAATNEKGAHVVKRTNVRSIYLNIRVSMRCVGY